MDSFEYPPTTLIRGNTVNIGKVKQEIKTLRMQADDLYRDGQPDQHLMGAAIALEALLACLEKP